MKTSTLLLLGLLLLMTLAGCQREMNPVAPSPTVQPGVPAPLGKITLPSGVTISSAILSFYPSGSSTGQTIDVYRITADWSEATVTWNNQPGSVNTGITFTTTSPGWNSVDITSLVQAWVNGTYDDYGVLLKQEGVGIYTVYNSSQWATVSLRPKLEITYVENSVTKNIVIQEGTFGAVEDSYIFQNQPDLNDGMSPDLFVGLYPADPPRYEKDLLIKFDVTIESEGCTRTPGYWKTHSIYGPAPYDNTWASLPDGIDADLIAEGADEDFFYSGQTYYQVLWTSTSGGNAYYILAHAYIAAQLNQLAGASIPAPVLTAFNTATGLFSNPTNTPAYIGGLKGSNTLRQQFLSLATILDDYNNGLTGPGHCE